MRWGERGRGQWITVFTNRGHAFAVIAGLRLDTSSPASAPPRAGRVHGARARPALAPDAALRARLPRSAIPLGF